MKAQLLLLAPILAPASGAALGLLLRRQPRQQLLATAVALATVVAAGVWLTLETLSVRVVHTAVGAHGGLKGIALVAEPFGASLVVATGLLALLVLGVTAGDRLEHHRFVYPLFLVLIAGACGSFVAGDLFNLFVLFEVALAASYVLLVVDGSLPRVRASAVYIAVNLVGTLLLLAGVAGVFAAAGTVNLPLLASEAGAPVGAGPAAALMVLAFTLKAGLLPFTGWLVVGYSNARPSVMALFVGTLTTVGIAALYRVALLAFEGAPPFRDAVLALAVATLVLAPLAAAASGHHARALALLVAMQVGFMAVGFGLGTAAGVSAGIFFVLQDVLIKAAVILAYGPLAAPVAGPRAAPLGPAVLGVLAVLGLSLVGFPPLAGFIGKALLVEAALAAGAPWVAALALAASAIMLAATVPLWREARLSSRPGAAAMVFTLPVAIAAVVVGVAPHWLIVLAETAADVLLNPAAFAQSVHGGSA